MGITKSSNNQGTSKPNVEISAEQKAEMKARDLAQLEIIKVEKDEIAIQIEHAKMALELKLPTRKLEAEIMKLEHQLIGITKNGKILEERNK